MTRRAHLLRSNRGSSAPVTVIGFDTETTSVEIGPDAVEARLAFGWAAVTRRHRGDRWTPPRWQRFDTPDAFWSFVDRETIVATRTVVVAHNVGFDFRVVDGFRQLPARGWEARGAVIDDPPTILRWRQGRRSLLVLDTLNYYRASLADVGRMVGLAKLDHSLVWTGSPDDDAYCRRDVEIVLAAFTGLVTRVRDLDLGNFAHTLPALAFTAWRHRHLTTPVLIDDNELALSIARAGYYGGRTEAFRIGPVRGEVAVFDVNSLYPYVMRETPVPTILRGAYRSVRAAELPDLMADAAVIADVTLTTERADFPLVHDGRLVFPVGTFRTVLPGPELARATAAGSIVQVHRTAIYDQALIFRSYVDEWYGRRLAAQAAGDVALAAFCKLMLNSLYGKLGQRGEVWEAWGETDPGDVRAWDEIDADTGAIYRFRALGGMVQRRLGEVEARDSHPAIAATITSAARVHLARLMDAPGRGNVLYVDTDSLFVPSGPSRAVLEAHTGPELGQLKLERVLRDLTIYTVKDYAAEGLERHKGVRASATALGGGRFVQDVFVGLAGAVRSGDLSRQVIRRQLKVLRRTYDKGIVDARGRVHPYRLG